MINIPDSDPRPKEAHRVFALSVRTYADAQPSHEFFTPGLHKGK